MTARRAHAYPQVDARAAGLINLRVIACPAGATAAQALDIVLKRSGRALALHGKEGLVLLEDLTRAVQLGLPALAADTLRRPVPVVTANETEITVRRRLLSGAPAVLVTERLHPIGAVGRSAVHADAVAGLSLAARLRSRVSPAALRLLTEVGRLAGTVGSRAFAVGGIVRDALIDSGADAIGDRRGPRDIDIVIEGDGIGLARRAARALGGRLTVHEAFGTASIEGQAGGRLDIVTARAERYGAPGALPTVRAGTIIADLERRDFTVNAMAIELSSGAFGLLDPLGGRQDVERRRIRVLHPLSFVEDPTRIFRAARYATRLGFTLDRASLRARALALRLAPYAALSGRRIAAEIELVLGDTAPGTTLGRLAACGAFRLLDRRFRISRASARRIAVLPDAIAWVRARRLTAAPLELAALAIVADQRPEVVTAALRALGLSGDPVARLLRTYAGVPALLARLADAAAAAPSARATLLRDRPAIDLAWAWLIGGAEARAQLDWYLAGASRVRAELRGEELVDLGVPRGPAVGLVLRRLRDARIDGSARSRDDEVGLVRAWRAAGMAEPSTARREG